MNQQRRSVRPRGPLLLSDEAARRGDGDLAVDDPSAAPAVAKGTFTRAEASVAALALRGLTNAEIASRRGSSPRTVANQMASIFRKLGIGSRRELLALEAKSREAKSRVERRAPP